MMKFALKLCPLDCLNFPRVGSIVDVDLGGRGGERLTNVADRCP